MMILDVLQSAASLRPPAQGDVAIAANDDDATGKDFTDAMQDKDRKSDGSEQGTAPAAELAPAQSAAATAQSKTSEQQADPPAAPSRNEQIPEDVAAHRIMAGQILTPLQDVQETGGATPLLPDPQHPEAIAPSRPIASGASPSPFGIEGTIDWSSAHQPSGNDPPPVQAARATEFANVTDPMALDIANAGAPLAAVNASDATSVKTPNDGRAASGTEAILRAMLATTGRAQNASDADPVGGTEGPAPDTSADDSGAAIPPTTDPNGERSRGAAFLQPSVPLSPPVVDAADGLPGTQLIAAQVAPNGPRADADTADWPDNTAVIEPAPPAVAGDNRIPGSAPFDTAPLDTGPLDTDLQGARRPDTNAQATDIDRAETAITGPDTAPDGRDWGEGDQTGRLALQADQAIRTIVTGVLAAPHPNPAHGWPDPEQHPGSAGKPSATTQIPASVTATGSGFELKMAVDDLGGLRMDFTRSGDRLHISVAAERPELLDLLRRHSDLLAAELRQSGFSGSDISFGIWGEAQGRPSPRPAIAGSGEASAEAEIPAADPMEFTRPLSGPAGQLDLRL